MNFDFKYGRINKSSSPFKDLKIAVIIRDGIVIVLALSVPGC